MADQGMVTFYISETDEKIEFYIIEQTRINNTNYILVADSREDEAEAYILRETYEGASAEESVYDIVEDDDELLALSKVFAQLLDDVDIEIGE